MDGLSIAAAGLAFSGAIAKVIQTLSRIRHGDEEVEQTIEKFLSLQRCLATVEEATMSEALATQALIGNERLHRELEQQLQQGKRRLLKLNDILVYKILKPDANFDQPRIRHLEWVRCKQKIEKGLSEAIEIRDAIAILLSSALICSSLRNARPTDTIPAQPVRRTEALLIEHAHPEEIRLQQSSVVKDCRQEYSRDTTSYRMGDPKLLLTPVDIMQAYNAAFNTQMSLPGRNCPTFCSCACHNVCSLLSPAWTVNFIGSISIQYQRLPLPECTEELCRRQSLWALYATIRYAPWIWSRYLRLAVTVGSLHDFNLCVSLPCYVPRWSGILDYARLGDLKGIQQMLASGGGSTRDVDVDGWTALSTAIYYDHFHLIEVLLAEGVDKYFRDKSGDTAVMAAWRKSQDLRYDETSRALLLRTLIDSDFLEALAHTPLHKSVLGLSLIPLEEHLRTSVSAINEIDAMGSTALCWAVYRNDHAAVAKLLASNASPNLGSRAPLIEAAMNGSVENMRALLSNGAHVSRQNQYGMSAIGKLCEYTVGTASHETRMLMARMLLNHGALINVRNIYGETPLMIAAGSAPLDMLQLLLSVSADVQIVDNEGYNALDWALNRKNQAVLGCLLERMRSLSAVSSVRLLDNVAECGHEQFMSLTETFSKKLTIDHIEFANRKGFWIHVYNKREDRTSSMDSAFKRLLENLQTATCKTSNTGNIEGIDQCPPLNMPGSWQDE